MNQAGGNPRRESGGCRGGSIVSVTQAPFTCSAERNDSEGAGLLCSQGGGILSTSFWMRQEAQRGEGMNPWSHTEMWPHPWSSCWTTLRSERAGGADQFVV